MKIITRRDRMKDVPENFRHTRWIWAGRENPYKPGKTWNETEAQVATLNLETVTEQELAAIIGEELAKAWLDVYCDQCRRSDCDYVVEVGEPEGYESCTACLCADCLTAAYRLHERCPSDKTISCR